VFSLTLATQYMHPDPPITEAAAFLSDGTAEIPFQKSVSDTSTETARGRTLYPTEPTDGYWTRVGRNIVADWQGLDPSLLTYHYRLYKVRSVDDENIADTRIVPVRPLEVLDAQGNAVPGRLKFVVPHEHLKDDINYFRIAAYQIYDRGGVPPERPEPFHYRDVLDPSKLPNFFPTLLGYTLSFASGFSTPSPAPPAWNYLTPIFRDTKAQAARAVVEARTADVLRGFEGAILGPAEQDYLYTKAVVKQHRTHLSQLREAQKTLLTERASTWAALERHAALLDLVGNNPSASWQGVNPVTQQAASVLGVPELPPSTAAALEQLGAATHELSRVAAVKDAMDLYNGKWTTFEADLTSAKLQAQQAGIQVTPEAVAEIQLQGRPAFQIQNNVLVGEPTFGPNTNLRVIAPFTRPPPSRASRCRSRPASSRPSGS
jgi:hypothetical protein